MPMRTSPWRCAFVCSAVLSLAFFYTPVLCWPWGASRWRCAGAPPPRCFHSVSAPGRSRSMAPVAAARRRLASLTLSPSPPLLPPLPPPQVSGQDAPEGISSFEEVDLPPALMENVRRCKYTKPTPVQVRAVCVMFACLCHAWAHVAAGRRACCAHRAAAEGAASEEGADAACPPTSFPPPCNPESRPSPPPPCSATPSPLAWRAAT